MDAAQARAVRRGDGDLAGRPGRPDRARQGDRGDAEDRAQAADSGGRGELVDAIAQEVVADTSQRKNPLHDFKPKGALAGQEILEELAEVNRIVSAKATPEEAEAYRDWLLAAAQEAANAAKEGGFMGFHAERVSEGEQRMLDKLAEVLAPPA